MGAVPVEENHLRGTISTSNISFSTVGAVPVEENRLRGTSHYMRNVQISIPTLLNFNLQILRKIFKLRQMYV